MINHFQKLYILLPFCVIIALFSGCNLLSSSSEDSAESKMPTPSVETKGVDAAENISLDKEKYMRIYNLLTTNGYSIPENTYKNIQEIAPNKVIISFEANDDIGFETAGVETLKRFYLNNYKYDNGYVCIVYDDENGEPGRCFGFIYSSGLIDSEQLKKSKSLADVYELTSSESADEFARYYRSTAFCPCFQITESNDIPGSDSLTLIPADDGFYLVEYEDEMTHLENDSVILNYDVKVKSINKCRMDLQKKIYEVIRDALY